MSSPCPERRRVGPACLLPLALVGALAACAREKREFDPPQSAASAPATRLTELQPGEPAPSASTPTSAPTLPSTPYTVEGNAYAVAQGKRLFRWYNCSGCHAPGGGGDWGPALSDDRWIYGSEPQDIYASIVQGRPAGMPSFGTHVSEDQVWDLVAYVRSLSGQLRGDVASGRSDGMSPRPPEARRAREKPKQQGIDDGTR